jgi:hypothetical protein
MIHLRETLQLAHETLLKNQINHALIGGFAMAFYGFHRATADVDFLADGQKRDRIKEVLLKAGFQLKYESTEVLQFVGVGFLDILLANRPLSQEMLTQANQSQELKVQILRAEDIIGLKIQAYKNDPSREFQDKSDIQNLLQLPNLEFNIVKKYAELFSEWDEIQSIMKKGKPHGP